MGLWNSIKSTVKVAMSVVAKVANGVKARISSGKSSSVGGGGGGVLTDDSEKTGSGNGTKASGGSGNSGDDVSSGNAGGDASTESNDSTTENVMINDPEKNKLLAEVRMSEELRETMSITISIPKILKGCHTNQWFFMDVGEGFYEKNYPMLIRTIADKKYGRYAGFEYGRFFIEKTVQRGGTDGTSMEITLNPIASNYGQYVKMQIEAEKSLIEALNDDTKYENNGAYGSGGSVSNMTLDEIYNIAATFTYGGAGTGLSPEKAWEHYQNGGRNFDCYDCSNWLFYCLREKKISCRIVQGYSPKSKSNTHRVTQIYENGEWHCPKQAWSLTMNLRPFTPEDKYPLTAKLTYTPNGGTV